MPGAARTPLMHTLACLLLVNFLQLSRCSPMPHQPDVPTHMPAAQAPLWLNNWHMPTALCLPCVPVQSGAKLHV
eukprot:scaffold267209_cov23-Tisochrysis_lutea.AAC.2